MIRITLKIFSEKMMPDLDYDFADDDSVYAISNRYRTDSNVRKYLEDIDGTQTSNYVEVLVQCERKQKAPDKCCLRALPPLDAVIHPANILKVMTSLSTTVYQHSVLTSWPASQAEAYL